MFAASLFTWGPLYYAILHAGVGISLTISYASIVLGMFFFGWLFANEKFTKEKALSACLGLAGLGLIFTPNIASLGLVALGAAFISGLSVSATMVSSKLIKYNPTMTTIVLWTTSVAANFVMALFFSNAHPTFGVHKEWLYLLLFSAASIIASWSLIRGLKLIDAGTAGVLGLLEIVFGVLFGIIFFNESLGGLTILGIVVIITAAAIPYISEYKSN